MEFYRVFLKNPLYEKIGSYTINPAEAYRIDPRPELYFASKAEDAAELPAGVYFFTQIKKQNLEESELLEMAVELQKEALWNRCKPGEKLYLRKLFEDNSDVTQLWRPVMPPAYNLSVSTI
jgi:hypothetical protein